MVASLRSALKADAASGETFINNTSFVSDSEDVDDPAWKASASDHVTNHPAPRQPWAFSKLFYHEKLPPASFLNAPHAELFSVSTASVDKSCMNVAQPAQNRRAGTPTSRTWFRSLPALQRLVRETVPKSVQRMSTSMMGL